MLKKPLDSGSSLTRSYTDRRGDSAVVRAWVDGVGTTGEEGQSAAIAAASLSATHGGITDLVLARARAYAVGLGRYFVEGYYQRSATAIPTLGTWSAAASSPAGEVEDFSDTVTSNPYTEGGVTYYQDSLQRKKVKIGLLSYRAPFVLDSAPDISLIQKINSSAFTINGRSHAAKTLRYHGPIYSVVDTFNGTSSVPKYVGHHLLLYKSSGWTTKHFKLDTWMQSNSTGSIRNNVKYTLSEEDDYPTGDFSGLAYN